MRDTPPSEVKILLHGNLRHGSFISSVAAGHTNQKEARWYFHSSSSKSHTLSFFIICILFAFFAPKVRRGIWQWPWNPTAACFYVSCFTEDLGDLSLLYVTVPFMAYIDHQGVQPLSRRVHYRQGIFHPRPHWQGSRDIWFTSPSLSTSSGSTLKKKTSGKVGQQSEAMWSEKNKTSHFQNTMDIFKTWCSRTRDIFLSHILLPYLNLVPTLPTIQQFGQRPGCVMQVVANVA